MEKQRLLGDEDAKIEMSTIKPVTEDELLERSRQYVLFLKELEGIVRRSIPDNDKDTEFYICVYNLFLTLASVK